MIRILLLNSFSSYKASSWMHGRLTKGFGVSCIYFVALSKKGFDTQWLDEFHRMPHRFELACPMMSSATGFNPYGARRNLDKKLHYACPSYLSVAKLAPFFMAASILALLADGAVELLVHSP